MNRAAGWTAVLMGALLVRPAQGVQVQPQAFYEYTSGSDSYTSHSGGGGLSFKFKNRVRLLGQYSLFADDDYSLIQTGTFRVRAPVGPDWEGSAALILSGGKLKGTDDRTSATALDFEAVRFLGEFLDATGGYRYTHGSLRSGVDREVVVVERRQTRTVTVTDELTRDYTAHTVSWALGADLYRWVKGLYLDGRLAVTSRTDGAPIYSQALEGGIALPFEFYFFAAYTLTQDADGPDRNYLSFSLSKSF